MLQALAENQAHIPYRNTKLTHILQDTIGGDSKLLVMLCVSPAQKYSTESLQCLGFGSRARQVARGPAKKRRPIGYGHQIPSSNIGGNKVLFCFLFCLYYTVCSVLLSHILFFLFCLYYTLYCTVIAYCHVLLLLLFALSFNSVSLQHSSHNTSWAI